MKLSLDEGGGGEDPLGGGDVDCGEDPFVGCGGELDCGDGGEPLDGGGGGEDPLGGGEYDGGEDRLDNGGGENSLGDACGVGVDPDDPLDSPDETVVDAVFDDLGGDFHEWCSWCDENHSGGLPLEGGA